MNSENNPELATEPFSLSELTSLTLSPSDIVRIFSAPPPPETYAEADTGEIKGAADNLFALWRQIVVDGVVLVYPSNPAGDRERESGEKEPERKGDLLWRLGAYWDRVLQAILSKEPRKGGPTIPRCLVLSELSALTPGTKDERPHASVIAWRLLTQRYLFTLACFHWVGSFRPVQPVRAIVAELEAMAHESIATLTDMMRDGVPGFLNVARTFMRGAGLAAQRAYATRENASVVESGPFSSIRLDEIVHLAKRAEFVSKKYGVKNVEKVFEQQLALVMQSFGLIVVSTRIGQATVDLVCISADPSERLTFIVEAKTSKNAYALPKKDSRALADYVADIKASLTTLPPLGFVLIVCGETTRTIDAKLTELEGKVSVPVRCMDALALVRLRDGLPGPLPLRAFRSLVQTSPPRMERTFVKTLVSNYESELAAHQQFVESMFRAKGVIA